MYDVSKIINELRKESSTNSKKDILMANKDNVMLKKILLYTYDPFRKYGVSEKILKEQLQNAEKEFLPQETIFEFLDKLAISNINNDLRKQIGALLNDCDEKKFDIIKCMLLKDLKIGVNASTINKVWKGLIPKFEVQLAKSFKDVKIPEKEYIYITEKLDGIRCVVIKRGDSVKFFTRQGKEILGLIDLEKEIKRIFENFDLFLDGELLAFNPDNLNSGDLYRKTVKIVNKKSGEKKGINYCVFDIMSLEEFDNKKCTHIYSERRKALDNWLKKEDTDLLVCVPLLYKGDNHEAIHELLDLMDKNNKEGIMINRDVNYEFKRHNGIIKVKTMLSADLRVVGYEEGTGRLEGKLGALIVDYKGSRVNVGSGFKDYEREKMWDQKDDIINKIVEVQYFEESRNEDGEISIRFPVFKTIRTDKTEPSYN